MIDGGSVGSTGRGGQAATPVNSEWIDMDPSIHPWTLTSANDPLAA